MDYDIFIVFGATIALILAIIAVFKLPRIRHSYLVSEGHAGLLYHKGKFVEVLGVGRHVRRGLYFTLGAFDLRKTSLLVAGQDVLTADNVSLKLSLLVTYQVSFRSRH
jgi:regulator of protease activity HflC (stomatin/prohibitin superfamily)